MFTERYRDKIRAAIIACVENDDDIVSAAVIGSYARKEVDEYSDIDLTFGLHESVDVDQVLHRYRQHMQEAHEGAFLFELKQGHTVYLVFLLPGCLQVDLSFAPQSAFGPKQYPFELLFGYDTGEKQITPPEPVREKFGLMIHHILRAKICKERNKIEEANDWLTKARKYFWKLNANRASAEDHNYHESYAYDNAKDVSVEIVRLIDDVVEAYQDVEPQYRSVIGRIKILR